MNRLRFFKCRKVLSLFNIIFSNLRFFKCRKVLSSFNIIFSNLRFMFNRYLILQNMKKSESVFGNKCKWIGLLIFIWQRLTFVNVLVNTFYLDPSSEFFFYSISFSLSMWFGFKKGEWFLVSLELPSNSPMHFLFRNFALIFNFFLSIDIAGKRRWVLLPLWRGLLSLEQSICYSSQW